MNVSKLRAPAFADMGVRQVGYSYISCLSASAYDLVDEVANDKYVSRT